MTYDAIIKDAKRTKPASMKLVIPVSGRLVFDFKRACEDAGVTMEACIGSMMREFVSDSRAEAVPLPGLRLIFDAIVAPRKEG